MPIFFVDNALFNDSEGIAGIIDFYYACKDALLLDVAIAVNDWCTTDDGGLDAMRAEAFFVQLPQPAALYRQ